MSSHPRHTESAVTIASKTSPSASPPMKDPAGSQHGSRCEGAQQRQQGSSIGAVSCSQLRWAGAPLVAKTVEEEEGLHEPCPSPIIHDRRTHRLLPSTGLWTGFEESPEWRLYYGPSSEAGKEEGSSHLPDDESRWLSDQSLTKTNTFSADALITTKTRSQLGSVVDAATVGSQSRLCLPRPPSGVDLLKAGNNRLKQLMRPRNKSYFRTRPVPPDEQDIGEQLERLELTASKRDLPTSPSKNLVERTGKEESTRSRKAIRNKESSTSILDLDQVEARHGWEKYHRATLSDSWDEIFKSIGGFRVDSAIGDDDVHQHGSPSASIGNHALEPGLPVKPDSPTGCGIQGSWNAPIDTPAPPPTPPTSSTTPTAGRSPPRQRLDLVGAESPGRSTTPKSWLTSKPANHEKSPTGTDVNFSRDEEVLRLLKEGARPPSSASLSNIRQAPDASPASIALEVIEAEMDSGRPLSFSTLTNFNPPFSINCTPPQPVLAPSEPPAGPLPELPAESGRAHAACRGPSHPPFSTQPAHPIISPTSHPWRDPSAKATGPDLTLGVKRSQRSHQRKQPAVSRRNPKNTSSIDNRQGIRIETASRRRYPSPEPVSSPDNNASPAGSRRGGQNSSQDQHSPAASETGDGCNLMDMASTASPRSVFADGVLSSRSQHIRQLKMRDLAKEKATRTSTHHPVAQGDNTSVVENPSLSAEHETSGPRPQPSSPVYGRPSDKAYEINEDPRRGGHQDCVSRRPKYRSRRRSAHGASQKTIYPVMGQSQIMVLAETDPNTQTFRASTPTGSMRRTVSRKAESAAVANEQKVRKDKSKAGVHFQPHIPTVQAENPAIEPKPEQPLRHSDTSTYLSDDGIESSLGRRCPPRRIDPIAALVIKEDSDIEPAASTRASGGLAGQEERKCDRERQRLKEPRRESSELRLAMRLLSTGLAKLTKVVELDGELNVCGRRPGMMMEAGAKPIPGSGERSAPSLGADDWEGLCRAGGLGFADEEEVEGLGVGDDAGNGVVNPDDHRLWANGSAAAAAAAPWSKERPLHLSSARSYSSLTTSMAEKRHLPGPAIKDEVIWTQLEGTEHRDSTVVEGQPC